VDATTSYTVLVITYQNFITDFPNIANAHRNGMLSEQNTFKKEVTGMKTGRIS